MKSMVFIILCAATTLNLTPGYGLRILGVFPFNGRSHFVMCERLMKGLAERGHQVDVYSHYPLKNPPKNYTDYNLAGSAPVLTNNMTYKAIEPLKDGLSVKQMINIVRPVNDLLGLPVFQKLIHNPPRYDVLIIAPFLVNPYLAFGRHLNIPVVSVLPFQSIVDWMHEHLGNPRNFATDPSGFLKFSSPMTFLERLENFVRSNYLAYAYNYGAREQDAVVEKYFGPGFPNVVELQKDIDLTLLNYHPALNGIRTHSPNVIPVAGLHIVDSDDELPKHVEKFLDEAKDGFIFVSFGSMVRFETFPKSDIEAFYKTFQNIYPVRVLMKIAKPNELPHGLPSNVITYHWLPQVKVLKHKNIKAFITHGGVMGTQESIYYGVPMIGFPLFSDQFINMEFYVRRNVAIKLDQTKFTEEKLTTAVKEILTNPLYKKSAEKLAKKMRDLPMDPMDTAAFWVEYIARHGKKALRPPVVDMPWWQASLLDVYAFILSVILTVLYVIKVAMMKLISIFFTKKFLATKNKTKVN